MKYYDLKQGTYKNGSLTEDEMWDAFDWLFSARAANDSSYKFIFFKAILLYIHENNELDNVSFTSIFYYFLKVAWPLVLKYQILQKKPVKGKKGTYLEQILLNYKTSRGIIHYKPFDEVDQSVKDWLCEDIVKECQRYVVGAFYGDTKELLYSFSKKDEVISFNQKLIRFIEQHMDTIDNLNYYKWADFYQKVNDKETEARIDSLIAPSFRRESESVYRSVLSYEFDSYSKTDFKPKYNTLEFVFIADSINLDEEDAFTMDEVESELFSSYEGMREYLKDPISLIAKLKKEKGVL